MRNFGSISLPQTLPEVPRSFVCAWRPVPGLPTEFSSAVVRAEAGKPAEEAASRVGRQESGSGGCGSGCGQ